MNKLWLIIKREYLTRVRKKSFILATLLTPLGIGLIAVVSGYFASSAANSEKRIMVVDDSGIFSEENLKSNQFTFELTDRSIDNAKVDYIKEGYDVLVRMPKIEDLSKTKLTADFYSKEKLSFTILDDIEDRLSDAIEEYKVNVSDIEQKTLDELKMNLTLENGAKLSDNGQSGDSSSKMSIIISTALSYIMGFLMYIVIFVYGGMVMRSVMEEKINRIVEVMISSVKPFQLMLGKVVGVGMVGLTQLALWLVLIPVIMLVVGMLYGAPDAAAQSAEAAEMMKQLENSTDNFTVQKLLDEIAALNWIVIIPSFVIFFLGGYFIYSSLFAAVGSAIGDDLGEGQQLMMPIMIPIILAFVMVPAVFNDPDGPIAVFGSMFPLFSPIIMPARLPFDPPVWQILISILILVGSAVFMIWFSGRIYRVGILMYGKKVSFKEIWKWLFYKG